MKASVATKLLTVRPKKIIIWLYSGVWKKKTGSVCQIFFFFFLIIFFSLHILWFWNSKDKMVYYTAKALLRNILRKIVYFGGKFHALKFGEKQFWEENLIFLVDLKKKIYIYMGQPCILGPLGVVQPNILQTWWKLTPIPLQISYSMLFYLIGTPWALKLVISRGPHSLRS